MQNFKCYLDVFFALTMVNSCKCYSSSFSDILGIRIASAAALQKMMDRGKGASREREIFCSLCGPHRLNRGLALNVCVVQCVKLFQCFTSFATALNYVFSFPLFLAKKATVSISSD